MASLPRRSHISPLLGAGLYTLALVLAGCESSGQACQSDEDCYVGEICVLQTCDLRDDSDPNTNPDADVDPDAAFDPDADIDPDADVDPDAGNDPDADANLDPDADVEPDAGQDTGNDPALIGPILNLDSPAYDRFHSVVEGPNNSLIALGRTTANDDGDATLTRIDANGDVLWHKALGAGGDDYLTSLLATSDGDYLAAGVIWRDDRYAPWLVRFEADGTITWQTSYDAEAIDATWTKSVFAGGLTERSDGSFVLGLSGTFYFIDVYTMGLLVVDGAGDVVRASRVNIDSEEPIAIVGDETLTLAGYRRHRYSGTQTFIDAPAIVHIGTSGRIRWQLPLPNKDARINAIRRAENGDILLAGWHEGNGANAYRPWAMKISEAGSILWQRMFASDEIEAFYAIETAPNGDLLMMASRADALEDGTYSGVSHVLRLGSETGELIDTQTLGHGESSDLAFYDVLVLEDDSLAMVGSSFRAGQTDDHAAALLHSTSIDTISSCTLLDTSPSFATTTSSMGPPEGNDSPFESVTSIYATRVDFDAFRVVDLATANSDYCPL